jgi:hypothetical protein
MHTPRNIPTKITAIGSKIAMRKTAAASAAAAQTSNGIAIVNCRHPRRVASEHVTPSSKQNRDNNDGQHYQLAAGVVEKAGLVGFSRHGIFSLSLTLQR